MQKTPLIKTVERAITPTTESMGFELVRVMLTGSGKPTLQIMAEKPDNTMGLEDCARLSQAISAVLDVEDIMGAAYYLEVSSPGIDRPLTRLKDFDRWKGFEARIELEEPVNGQKRFKGLLKGIEGDNIVFDNELGEHLTLPFDIIQKAKLILTDELIKAVQSQDDDEEEAPKKPAGKPNPKNVKKTKPKKKDHKKTKSG